MFDLYFLYDAVNKKPAIGGWQNTINRLSVFELNNGFRKDDPTRPLGINLRAEELVIDVDPRNGGEASFRQLCEDSSYNISQNCNNIVKTGGDGFHYYYTKPGELSICKQILKYPGIEFLSKGSNVIAPGSTIDLGYYEKNKDKYSILPKNLGHYSVEEYLFKNYLSDIEEVPTKLLNLIKTKTHQLFEKPKASLFSLEQLKWCLYHLNPVKFRNYESWLQLQFSIHAACGGSEEGREIFAHWSALDEKYKNRYDEVAKHWGYAQANKKGGVTQNTLNKIMYAHGVNINDFIMLKETEGEGELAAIDNLMNKGSSSTLAEVVLGHHNLKDWFFVMSHNCFYNPTARVRAKPEAFNRIFTGMMSLGKQTPTTYFLTQTSFMRNRAIDARYEPYKPLTYLYNKNPILNTWQPPPTVEPVSYRSNSVKFWFDHIRYLFAEDEKQIELFHQYFTLLIQKRRRRLNYAMVIYSYERGVGKTTPVMMMLHKHFGRGNVAIVDDDVINSSFNASYTECEVTIFEDVATTGRFEVVNKLKPLISDKYITRHAKGLDAVSDARNFTSAIIFTNHKNALAIDDKERRFLVLQSQAIPPLDPDYFPSLIANINKNSVHVLRYYKNRKIDFDKLCQRAPYTKARQEMIEASMPTYAQVTLDIIKEEKIPHIKLFILIKPFFSRYIESSYNKNNHRETQIFVASLTRLGYINKKTIKINQKIYYGRFKSLADYDNKKVKQQLDYLLSEEILTNISA